MTTPAGSGQLLVRYLGVCAALLAVLVAVTVYAVVSSGSGEVTIRPDDSTTSTTDTATETTP